MSFISHCNHSKKLQTYLCFSEATTFRMNEISLFSHDAQSEGETKARAMMRWYTRELCWTMLKKSI
jgi:hypothetical protein